MIPLVYIAAPYTNPDPVENSYKAIQLAELVEMEGCYVAIPHLSLMWHLVSPAPYEKWMERDAALMSRCDAVVRGPGKSTGADIEVEMAMNLGLPVFFWPEDDERLRGWIREYRL